MFSSEAKRFKFIKQTDENHWSLFQGSAGAASSVLLFCIYWSRKMLMFDIAPEMERLHFYFSANCLNGLLHSLNVCVSSSGIQLRMKCIHLLTLNNMFLWAWVPCLLINTYLIKKKKGQNREKPNRPLVVGKSIGTNPSSFIFVLFDFFLFLWLL